MTAFLGLASFLFFKAGRATDLAEDFFDCLAIRFWTGLKGLALVEPFFAAFFGAAFFATFFGAAFFGAAFFAAFLLPVFSELLFSPAFLLPVWPSLLLLFWQL